MKIVENEFKDYAVAASETDFFKRVKRIKTISATHLMLKSKQF